MQARRIARAKAPDSRRLHEELCMAGEFQRAVLPEIPRLDYLRGDLRYLPYDTISGDVYDFVQTREREIGVFVGDATGHGVIAAFMTMMVHLGLDGLRPDLPTNEAMRRLNGLLAARNTGRWITAVYFRITPSGGLSVTHAGHPSLLILPRRGGKPVSFDEGGCALGMFAEVCLE
jgi:sigma-B regulation protein RsbU (phosphoserine phosphatase)